MGSRGATPFAILQYEKEAASLLADGFREMF